MYIPLGVDLHKVWDVPRVQPDSRLAPSASIEARKIKRGITRMHLESLRRYEKELLQRFDRNSVEVIYNRSGLPMPVEPKDENRKGGNKDIATNTGTLRKHDADYKAIQSARSRFHPVKAVREQAAANLVLLEKQEMEEWKRKAEDWVTTTVYSDTCSDMDAEGSCRGGWTDDNSDDLSDTDSAWSDVDDDRDSDDDDDKNDEHAQWEKGISSGDETEDLKIANSESHGAVNLEPSEHAACDLLVGLPAPTQSETTSPRLAHSLARHELISDTRNSSTDQEKSIEDHSHAAEKLAFLLNDKRMLNVYLSKLEEGIKEAWKSKAQRDTDRENARQYYAGPTKRPEQARRWDRQWEPEEGQRPAGEEMPLRWFECESMHIYNELSGQWEVTVERRGRDYRLARASDTETLART